MDRNKAANNLVTVVAIVSVGVCMTLWTGEIAYLSGAGTMASLWLLCNL